MELHGGRLTAGVVRIGETVRRPASPFTAVLLPHLTAAGFDGAPRYLGCDELGRDVLSFVPGEVPAKWRSFSDSQIAQAGLLLRGLHAASRGLIPGRVICHHDAGPNNTVFRGADERPVAFIDFDFAAAGEPLSDVGYMAWSWCVSSKPARGKAADQAHQVRVLADAYGLTAPERTRLPAAILERLAGNERFWSGRVDVVAGPSPAEMVAWTRREAAFVRRHLGVFTAALAA